jgi:hypothetical protein
MTLISQSVKVQAVESRNRRLAESDWTQMPDSPLDDATKAAWATYRQELRDLPSAEGFPNVAFPTPPSSGE